MYGPGFRAWVEGFGSSFLSYHSGAHAKEFDAQVNFTPLENGGTEPLDLFLQSKCEGTKIWGGDYQCGGAVGAWRLTRAALVNRAGTRDWDFDRI
jgi:hypothetical protein